MPGLLIGSGLSFVGESYVGEVFDTPSGSVEYPAPLPHLGFILTGVTSVDASFTESGSSGETTSATASFVSGVAIAETGSAAHTPAATYVAAAVFSESVSATDAPAATFVSGAAFSETGSPDAALTADTGIGRGGDAAPLPSLGLLFLPYAVIVETGSAAHAPAATASHSSGIVFSEAGSAAESFGSAAGTYNDSFSEAGSVAHTPDATQVTARTFAETGSASESFTAPDATARAGDPMPLPHMGLLFISGAAIVVESGSAAHTPVAAAISAATFAESAVAAEQFASSSIGSAEYPAFLPHMGPLYQPLPGFTEDLDATESFDFDGVIAVGAFAEAVTALHTPAATILTTAAVSEAVSAATIHDALGAGEYSHDGNAGESFNGELAEVNAFSEAGSAAETTDAELVAGTERVFTEVASGSEAVSAVQITERTFSESATATDAVERAVDMLAEFLEEGLALSTFDQTTAGQQSGIFLEPVTAGFATDAYAGNAEIIEGATATEAFDAVAQPSTPFVEDAFAQDMFIAGVDHTEIVTVPGAGGVDPGPAPSWPPGPTSGGVVQMKPKAPRRIAGVLYDDDIEEDDEEIMQAAMALLLLRKVA